MKKRKKEFKETRSTLKGRLVTQPLRNKLLIARLMSALWFGGEGRGKKIRPIGGEEIR